MGLIRRGALEAVGGWDEWCITEDAELSLRLLRAGWSGLHVDDSYGHGVMPLTFEALKSQRYRWCFGGIQILRMHWRSTAARRADDGEPASAGAALGLLRPAPCSGTGTCSAWRSSSSCWSARSTWPAAAASCSASCPRSWSRPCRCWSALGLLRAVALLRRGTGASWRDAVGAFLVWQSTALVVARASVQGLFAKRAEFLRTPKTTDRTSWWTAIRANWAETGLAVLGLAGIAAGLSRVDTYAGPLLAGLLLFPTLGLAAAPVNSLAAQRATLPPDLGERRRTEWLRDRRVRGAAVGVTAAGTLVGIGIVAALLSTPSSAPVQPPRLIGPAQGKVTPAASPGPSSSPGGSPSPSGSAPGGPASSGPSATGGPSESTGPSPTATPGPTGSLAPTATVAPTTAPAPATTTP